MKQKRGFQVSQSKSITVVSELSLPSEITVSRLSPMVQSAGSIPVSVPVENISEPELTLEVGKHKTETKLLGKALTIAHKHSLIIYLVLILAIAIVAKPVVLSLWRFPVVNTPTIPHHSPTFGLNISVNKSELPTWLSSFTNQPAKIDLGTQTVNINPDILKSWVKITSIKNSQNVGVHLNTTLVKSTLLSQAAKYETSPINQVSITRSNGSNEIAVFGKNGYKLPENNSIASQASDISKNLFSDNGFTLSAPLVTVPFSISTPASFNKLIAVDVNSKVMYVYENGNLIKTYLVSAGAPLTPTPIGEFHIYSKMPLQNMTGFNPNGTKYFQPNVEWINYFAGADAIHGVYWHPLSWFGVHNSSHGCVGLPDDEAAWIYNWAPIGTTVITTPN